MSKIQKRETASGYPLPLGAYPDGSGAHFSLFSRNAESVTLVLFHNEDAAPPFEEITLDPLINKTGDIWHIWVKDVVEGQHYGYRIDGPYDPYSGHRFNRHKLIIDPYARALSKSSSWDLTKARAYNSDSDDQDLSFSTEDSAPFVPHSILMPHFDRDYQGQIATPMEDTIIYELHLKGFTRHESSGVSAPGTFAGIIEKIPYLRDLGVTAVELLPVQEFDAYENININPLTGEQLTNYWGYSTIAFFAPKGTYAKSDKPGGQVREFRDMVRAFHDAGIEVILDIVFNHTGEGDQMGPTVSFKGIDNSIYYILDDSRRFYRNFSGCGNTVNCNHPLVRGFILDALRYWVIEMDVDGFRFDLASVLGRDSDGNILSDPPLIERIEEDPILRNTKIIAEAWDAAGAYQVGQFPGRWAEWNGKYRDDVRQFWHGHKKSTGDFATRITGSSDLYNEPGRGPTQSINFITCHDGFTLNDLVSFREKHNIENGEDNRDGDNHNISRNFGIEGLTATPFIEKKRIRMIKNFIATLFLSQGIPMLLAGDEFRRTQRGNNNSYCQDNDISWIDWSFIERNQEVCWFTRSMINFRKSHASLRRNNFFTGSRQRNGYPDVSWHDREAGKPDWSKDSTSIALLMNGEAQVDETGARDADIYIIFNADVKNSYFEIPQAPSGRPWKLILDTANPSPDDFFPEEMAPLLEGSRYYVRKQSTVVLISS